MRAKCTQRVRLVGPNGVSTMNMRDDVETFRLVTVVARTAKNATAAIKVGQSRATSFTLLCSEAAYMVGGRMRCPATPELGKEKVFDNAHRVSASRGIQAPTAGQAHFRGTRPGGYTVFPRNLVAINSR